MSRFQPNARNHFEPLRAGADSIAPRSRRKPSPAPVYRKALILLGLVATTLFGLAFWLEPRLPSVQPGESSSAQAALPTPSTLKPALATAVPAPAPATTPLPAGPGQPATSTPGPSLSRVGGGTPEACPQSRKWREQIIDDPLTRSYSRPATGDCAAV